MPLEHYFYDCDYQQFLARCLTFLRDIESDTVGLYFLDPSPSSEWASKFEEFKQDLANFRNFYRQNLCESFRKYIEYRIKKYQQISKKNIKVRFSFSTSGILSISEVL